MSKLKVIRRNKFVKASSYNQNLLALELSHESLRRKLNSGSLTITECAAVISDLKGFESDLNFKWLKLEQAR